MTNRLVIHFPSSTITLEVDNPYILEAISTFCVDELGAYHATEAFNELTVDTLDQEMSDNFHSLMFELGLF